ncbi:hypothetical protein COY95_01585 [Candidatus Woesearchaeota archaeon CG_4_10_14_0_8_um_filter_47_5]|nr:MAG: hypothetical protein COY95_01585 [Candidatus Woesearchaeota archaeon CG_4_10_14_0_8_um_filter_47_5]
MNLSKLSENKKGVSPLIATVILIAFAISIGAVVMNIGKSYVDDQRNQENLLSGCPGKTQISWYKSSGEDLVCLEGDNVVFTVENGPAVELADLKVIIEGEKNFLTKEQILDEPLAKTGLIKIELPYNKNIYGPAKQVKVIPIVEVEDEPKYCQERELVKTPVGPCS